VEGLCAGLVFAEAALAAHSASATCAGRAGRRLRLARTPGDGAGSAADQPFDVATALGATVDRGVRHLLSRFKMAGAFVAKIFIGWQEISPQHHFRRVVINWH
jgi:hypothetical protein